MEQPNFIIVLMKQQFCCFKLTEQGWSIERLFGECSVAIADYDINQLIQQLDERLNSEEHLKALNVIVGYASDTQSSLLSLVQLLEQYNCVNWQVFSLDALGIETDALMAVEDFDPYSLHTSILHTVPQHEPDMESVNSESAPLDELQQQIIRLQKEKKTLQAEVSMMRALDIEQMVAFLPIIYKNVWLTLKPSDLAIMLGVPFHVPEITSPFPEPSADTIHRMRKLFKALSSDEQRKIIGFCQSLSHPLEVRVEMADVFKDA